MKRPCTIMSFPGGYHHLKLLGIELRGEKFTDWKVANERCDQLNEKLEDWRLEANEAERKK